MLKNYNNSNNNKSNKVNGTSELITLSEIKVENIAANFLLWSWPSHPRARIFFYGELLSLDITHFNVLSSRAGRCTHYNISIHSWECVLCIEYIHKWCTWAGDDNRMLMSCKCLRRKESGVSGVELVWMRRREQVRLVKIRLLIIQLILF